MKTKKTSNSFFLNLVTSFTIFMTAEIFTLVSNLETVSATYEDDIKKINMVKISDTL